MNQINKMKELLAEIEKDATKFFTKGTKEAGLRVRKKIKELQATAHELRVETLKKEG